jgi:hypothetical protein
MENFKKKIKKKVEFFLNFFCKNFWAIYFPQPIWGLPAKMSRLAGLGVKGIRTNSSKRLSQIIK